MLDGQFGSTARDILIQCGTKLLAWFRNCTFLIKIFMKDKYHIYRFSKYSGFSFRKYTSRFLRRPQFLKQIHISDHLNIQQTVNFQLSCIKASKILTEPIKIPKKIYYFYKVSQKEFCNVDMFTSHAIIIPVMTINATRCPPSRKCHYNRS